MICKVEKHRRKPQGEKAEETKRQREQRRRRKQKRREVKTPGKRQEFLQPNGRRDQSETKDQPCEQPSLPWGKSVNGCAAEASPHRHVLFGTSRNFSEWWVLHSGGGSISRFPTRCHGEISWP
ncbi:hypothetical protein A0J61_11390 [Choanephora cucurbitarum]|uniref:Uncharacterized protein n=1 Tax=Choanephora cucurbitarum TaxID=101091 RepID=A0A1C7MUM2_9FUNG|nr:hypothetical protein A0J61_11390 [Choanephora cucurbitarum]